MKVKVMIVGAAVAAAALAYTPAPVVFETPAADEKGVMVLGNGEVIYSGVPKAREGW